MFDIGIRKSPEAIFIRGGPSYPSPRAPTRASEPFYTDARVGPLFQSRVSVGRRVAGDRITKWTLPRVPTVGQPTTGRPAAPRPQQVDRRDVTSPSTPRPVQGPDRRLNPPGKTLGPVRPTTPAIQPKDNDMGMDLGTFLGNVGTIASAYRDIRYPQQTPTYQMMGNPAGAAAVALSQQNLVTLPGVDCIPEPPSCDLNSHYWSTRANKGQGGWVKYRRRRKRLATHGDINDLASLKTVLSPSDMKMWIATHS